MTFRFVLVVSLLLSAAGGAFAGQFGPVVPTAGPGEVSQEIGYFHSVGKWTTDENGFDDGKITMNQAYLQAGYGLVDGWEGYFRLGGSDLRQEKAFALDDSEMKGSVEPFVTLGARGVLYEGKVFDLGLFLQGTYFAPFKDSKTINVSGTPVKEELRLKNLWDVNLGLTLQAELGRAFVYAGPVAYYGAGRLETKVEVSGLRDSNSATYEERGNFGGVAGINVQLAKGINLFVEGQYKSELSAGAAATYLRVSY